MSDRAPLPWPQGASSGIGAMPGDDIGESLRIVLGECPELPFLPELPARGPGAEMVGRGAALLAELAVDLQPAGWRLVDRPGRDLRRSRDLLHRDLDALEELAGDYEGALKVQAAGPWTLAASVELTRGDKALSDAGARRDIAESLAEGLREHVADVQRRVPRASILLQLDEPSLPAVLRGRVPTASGFGTLPVIEDPEAESALAAVLARIDAFAVVHCCAIGAPIDLLRRAGARALSLDASLIAPDDDEQLGTAVEAGVGLLIGLVPGVQSRLSDPVVTVEPVRAMWRRLGFPAEQLPTVVVVTPACGLAATSVDYARAALRHCRVAARVLTDDPEGRRG